MIQGNAPRRRLDTLAAVALVAALAVPLVLAGAAPAAAQEPPPPTVVESGWRPRPVRAGTVALNASGMYGALLGGPFSDSFNHGLGLGFALRYRNSTESSLGLGFESHQFDGTVGGDSATTPVKLQLVVTTFDYYRHFSARTRTPRYLVIGAGLVQSRQTDLDGEKEYPGDGGVVKLGGGFEYWANRTLTIDVGLRYYGVLSESSLNHDLQAAIGLNFYTSP